MTWQPIFLSQCRAHRIETSRWPESQGQTRRSEGSLRSWLRKVIPFHALLRTRKWRVLSLTGGQPTAPHALLTALVAVMSRPPPCHAGWRGCGGRGSPEPARETLSLPNTMQQTGILSLLESLSLSPPVLLFATTQTFLPSKYFNNSLYLTFKILFIFILFKILIPFTFFSPISQYYKRGITLFRSW